MVLEPRTEGNLSAQGCDGRARDSAMLSAGYYLPAADEVHVVRRGRIWGGITRLMLSSPKTMFSGMGAFLFA